MMPDPRDFRLRYLLAVFLVAIAVAATLRHALHVYGGWTREDIAIEALIAAVIVGGLAILLERLGRRKSG